MRNPTAVRGLIGTLLLDAKRAGRRVGHRSHRRAVASSPQGGRLVPPERPVGAKLEITHRCNLLCSFCYTDSPAKTRTKPQELSGPEWMGVIDEVIALGVVEAVVTGGEPLLRKQLSLDIIEKLTTAGVGVVMNTNGWFLDDRTADFLAGCGGVTVSVSLDGFAPEVHDAERGVDGSWAKAVTGIDRLLSRGVAVRIAHVVTPANQTHLRTFLDGMRDFGVTRLRIVIVSPDSGNATRVASRAEWAVDVKAVRACVADFKRRSGSDLRVALVVPDPTGTVAMDTPDVFLLRPNGDLVFDSLRPVRFGTVAQGVAASWSALRGAWPTIDPPELSRRLDGQIAYRDPDVDLPNFEHLAPAGSPVSITRRPERGGSSTVSLSNGGEIRVPESALSVPTTGGGVAVARTHLRELVSKRRLQTAPMRWAGDADGTRQVRLGSGAKHVVSANAGELLDLFTDARTIGEVVDNVVARHGLSDVCAPAVWAGILPLINRGLLVPVSPSGAPA